MTVYFLYVRYLVDAGWFNKWKDFVGYDEKDQSNKGKAHPGPIDNSPLLKESGRGSIDIHLHHHLSLYDHYSIHIQICLLEESMYFHVHV